MGLSERVEKEHRALVECLEGATEHSSKTILEMGARLGDVMTQGLHLRTLMQTVGSMVGTTRTADLGAQLALRSRTFRDLTSQCVDEHFMEACSQLAQTLDSEGDRFLADDQRRQTEVLALTNELGVITGVLLTQASEAISALQFQDPAIQELRRIDSLVLELRRAIDSDAEAVKWVHRVGDVRKMAGTAPLDLARRALAIKQDTARRVQSFEAQTREAIAEIRRVHANLRSVTHAQVTKSAQTAQSLDSVSPSLDPLKQTATSLGKALSRLDELIQTGQQLTGNLSRILKLSENALQQSDDRRTTITVATDVVSVLASQLAVPATTDGSTARVLAERTRDALRGTHETLEALVGHDQRIRALAVTVEDQLRATRVTFAAFAEPLNARASDPVPKLLKDASEAAARMFDVIVEEFHLDPSTIEPDTGWQESNEVQRPDDVGLILL